MLKHSDFLILTNLRWLCAPCPGWHDRKHPRHNAISWTLCTAASADTSSPTPPTPHFPSTIRSLLTQRYHPTGPVTAGQRRCWRWRLLSSGWRPADGAIGWRPADGAIRWRPADGAIGWRPADGAPWAGLHRKPGDTDGCATGATPGGSRRPPSESCATWRIEGDWRASRAPPGGSRATDERNYWRAKLLMSDEWASNWWERECEHCVSGRAKSGECVDFYCVDSDWEMGEGNVCVVCVCVCVLCSCVYWHVSCMYVWLYVYVTNCDVLLCECERSPTGIV